MNPYVITLHEGELAVAWFVGLLRHFVDKAMNVVNRNRGPQSDLAQNVVGVIGEIAFAKCMDKFPTLSIIPRRGAPDLIVSGIRVDVKCTRDPNGPMYVLPHKINEDIDRYVLGVLIADNVVEFRGWAARGDVFQPARLRDCRSGKNYVVPVTDLRPFNGLPQQLNEAQQAWLAEFEAAERVPF